MYYASVSDAAGRGISVRDSSVCYK